MKLFTTIILSLLILTSFFSGKINNNITNRWNENIPAYLDSIIPYMTDFAKGKDSIYDVNYHEDGYISSLVGRFIDGKEIFGIYYIEKDTLTNFYHFNNNQWKLVGSERLSRDEACNIEFEDMDNDGQNEIIISSHPNMNGNYWIDVFHCSQNNQISCAGSFSTDYIINKEQKTVQTDYGGSWYMPLERRLYRWQGEKLVLEKAMVLKLKEPSMDCDEHTLAYYENSSNKQTSDLDSLSLIYKIPCDTKKEREKWDNFFDENK